jgi:hypothetical protein
MPSLLAALDHDQKIRRSDVMAHLTSKRKLLLEQVNRAGGVIAMEG